MLRRTRIASCFCWKRTCTFDPVAMHTLQHVSSDSTSVTVAVKTSVTPCWLLGGAALSVGAPLLPTQGSLRRSLVDGLRPPLTREPLRRPWAGWGRKGPAQCVARRRRMGLQLQLQLVAVVVAAARLRQALVAPAAVQCEVTD